MREARTGRAARPPPSPPPSASPRDDFEKEETEWQREAADGEDFADDATDPKSKGRKLHWRSGFLKGKATLGIMRK